MTAIEDARAIRANVDRRCALPRLGVSLHREMDRDVIALQAARSALDALIAEHEHLTADRDLWKRRCAEETIAWADATERADAAESLTAPPTDDVDPVVAVQTWMAADVHSALGRGNITESNDGDRSWADWWARLMHDVRALTAPPTDDEREALVELTDALRDEFLAWGDEPGEDTDLIIRLRDVVRRLGFRRQGPITDEWEYAWRTDESHVWPYDQYDHEDGDTLTEVVDIQAEPWWSSEVVEGMNIHRRRKATPAGPWEPVAGDAS